MRMVKDVVEDLDDYEKLKEYFILMTEESYDDIRCKDIILNYVNRYGLEGLKKLLRDVRIWELRYNETGILCSIQAYTMDKKVQEFLYEVKRHMDDIFDFCKETKEFYRERERYWKSVLGVKI